MALTEEILQHIQTLPEAFKAEVLDFIEYLELKAERSKKGEGEEIDWSTLSLSFAMRGMEKESTPYTIDDLKERFI
ncbi:MAG TPA: DUF2281 domain-containing protein [Candidatus Brocadiales bacterium]|nr:DUF2281 domain-containing protein [Candidatus Brocadiales bacterium]